MKMKVETQPPPVYDKLKWAVVIVLVVMGIIANQYFSTQALALRLSLALILICIVGFIAFQTVKGRQTLTFLADARIELRKVIWPSRQETVQTTLIVVVMVIVVALFLWGVDSLLLWIIGLLTGQRG